MIDPGFWKGKRVFITGHTGFKGSWLCLLLHRLGAQISGYALLPPTEPNLYSLCNLDRFVVSTLGDVRDDGALCSSLLKADPEIVIHMAAQSLVRMSYENPVQTFATNVMGTVHLLEAVRRCRRVRAVVNVTTDKCYQNRGWPWGYREDDTLGGHDPYSNSKACSELVSDSFRRSFFSIDGSLENRVTLATARAGNVIGGGDWAVDRLVPDCIRAMSNKQKIILRNPAATRPWQHVLEPLNGYLVLAERLFLEGAKYAEGWNFGPGDEGARSVEWLVRSLCEKWGEDAGYEVDGSCHPHEACSLKLDCSKATERLGWHPRWTLDQALEKVIEFNKSYQQEGDLLGCCFNQIEEYSVAGKKGRGTPR